MNKNIKNIVTVTTLIGLLILSACSNEPSNDSSETTPPTESTSLTSANYPSDPVTFCGLANPENATELTNEQALSHLALVNRCYRLSSTFTPDDLSPINVESRRVLEGTHHLLREEAARAAEDLFQAAEADGLFLVASSGFRSYEWQTFFHNNAVSELGLEEARRISAVPGHSEHQLGLALDVSTRELDGGLEQTFSSTPEGQWLNANAHLFGFIISYPEGREADTGFIYEPWHIRFVGVDAATEIFNNQLILEEFLHLSHSDNQN